MWLGWMAVGDQDVADGKNGHTGVAHGKDGDEAVAVMRNICALHNLRLRPGQPRAQNMWVGTRLSARV